MLFRSQVSPDGLLSIRGRDNNVVNLGGAKTTLELMEAKYFSAPGVGDVAVVLCRDASGIDRAVAVVAPGEKWSEAAFWSYCHGHVSREFWPVRVVTVDRIPRGQGGKVDRPAVRALV
mgnify:FL=1